MELSHSGLVRYIVPDLSKFNNLVTNRNPKQSGGVA